MEKTYKLDAKEAQLHAQLEQERMQALAAVGALSLDIEQAKKNLDTMAERQRSFVRHALLSRGVDRYESARTQNGALVVVLADPPAVPEQQIDLRPNGALPAAASQAKE